MPEISVLMRVFNREESLYRAVQSILKQDFTDFELLLMNSGSTNPKTLEILKMVDQMDERIKLLEIYPNNRVKSLNMLLDHCQGRYVTYMDDDDIAAKDMLSFLYQLIQQYSAEISICGSYRVSYGKRYPYRIFDECMVLNKQEAMKELLKRDKINATLWCKLFKREIFDNVRLREHENIVGEDACLMYRLFAKAESVVAHGLPKYWYMKDTDGVAADYLNREMFTPAVLAGYLALYRERADYLLEIMPEIKIEIEESLYDFYVSMLHKIEQYQMEEVCQAEISLIKNEMGEMHYARE